MFVLISKVESNPHCGHAISANLDVVGRHNAIDLFAGGSTWKHYIGSVFS